MYVDINKNVGVLQENVLTLMHIQYTHAHTPTRCLGRRCLQNSA